jgi:hypothetical protein
MYVCVNLYGRFFLYFQCKFFQSIIAPHQIIYPYIEILQPCLHVQLFQAIKRYL